MNYWATRLGTPAPAPAATPAAPATTPWWANDYSRAIQQPVQQQRPPAQQVPVEEPGGWGTVKGSMAKAMSSKSSESCPECGSGNIFRPTPNSMLQCYECGHNPRFSQTGGQGGLPSGDAGPATPARQLSSGGAGGVSQFNPQTIVGRL